MKSAFLLILFLPTILFGKSPDIGEFVEVCGVDFKGFTQMGDMKQRLSVCELRSRWGRDSSLFIISTSEKEFPPHVVKILESAHSPVIEGKESEIRILYSAGVNSTCVVTFSIEKGFLEFVAQETIAWNDQGVYRTSLSFADYKHMLEKRRHNKSVE